MDKRRHILNIILVYLNVKWGHTEKSKSRKKVNKIDHLDPFPLVEKSKSQKKINKIDHLDPPPGRKIEKIA